MTAETSEGETAPELSPQKRPLVFISHDSRDAELAEAFELLLADSSGGTLRAFRSTDKRGTSGIEFGADWYATIMQKLGEATDVVALLTPNSVERPWILYEVGVARGKLSAPAFGVAFGIGLARIAGPFAQFQNSSSDEDSLTKLVLQLIKRNPEATPREQAVRLQVKAFREQLPKLVGASASATSSSEVVSAAKFYEEIKVMFRELSKQLEMRIAPDAAIRRLLPKDENWLQRGREVVAALFISPPDDRANRWDDLMTHIASKTGRPPVGMLDVWKAVYRGNDEQLRSAVSRLEAVTEDLELRSTTDLDRDVSTLLRIAIDAIATWRVRGPKSAATARKNRS